MFKKAAEEGKEDAQAMLGALYLEGKGVAKSFMSAAVWLKKAAEQGNAPAQFYLG